MRRFNRYKRPSTRIHASSGGIKWCEMHGERKLCLFVFLIMTHTLTQISKMAPANFVGAGKPLCNPFMVYCVLQHVISPGAITRLNLYLSFHLDSSYLVSNFYSRYQ